MAASTTAKVGHLSGVPVRSAAQLHGQGPMADPHAMAKSCAVTVKRVRQDSDGNAPPLPPKSKTLQEKLQAPRDAAGRYEEQQPRLAEGEGSTLPAGYGTPPPELPPPPLARRKDPPGKWFAPCFVFFSM